MSPDTLDDYRGKVLIIAFLLETLSSLGEIQTRIKSEARRSVSCVTHPLGQIPFYLNKLSTILKHSNLRLQAKHLVKSVFSWEGPLHTCPIPALDGQTNPLVEDCLPVHVSLGVGFLWMDPGSLSVKGKDKGACQCNPGST
jgi:hypothetical protein